MAVEEIKIIKVDKVSSGQEFGVGENVGEQHVEITRFPKNGQGDLLVGRYYRGYLSPKPPPDPKNPDKSRNAKFDVICPIDGFNGTEVEWEENKEMDARQKSILVQSDIRAASMLSVALIGLTGWTFDPQESKDWIKMENIFKTTYYFIKKFREEQEAK